MASERTLCNKVLSNDCLCPYYTGAPPFQRLCFTHTSPKHMEEAVGTCAVCLTEKKVQFRVSCCQQPFCRGCLIKHTTAGGTQCPMCRAPLSLDLEGVERIWRDLKHKAILFKQQVRGLPFLHTQEALDEHIAKLIDEQKTHELELLKTAYAEDIQAVETLAANAHAAWQTNREGWRDNMWKAAEEVRHTVGNVNTMRSAAHPTGLMALSAVAMIHSARQTIEKQLNPDDILGLHSDEEEDSDYSGSASASASGSGSEDGSEGVWEDMD